MLQKCFLNHHRWTNSLALKVYYDHFMLTGFISADKGGTGWEVHEKERPSEGDIEIPFEVARLLSFIIDPENPLSGDLEEKIKNDKWCFITYPDPPYGNWNWISGLMPYEAYLNARKAGGYQHTDYSVCTFSSFQEAKEVYDSLKRRG